MLNCEPSDIEEPSEEERSGVPAPELEVEVLERDLDGNGRVKADIQTTNSSAPKTVTQPWNSQPDDLLRQQHLLDSGVPIMYLYHSLVSKLERRYRRNRWFFNDMSFVR